MTEAPFPHCNSEVLHAPGECVYCDEYPDRQAMRIASNTPFSPLEANGWSGNIAWTPQMVLDEAAYWEEVREHYRVGSREVQQKLDGSWKTVDPWQPRTLFQKVLDAWKHRRRR